MSLRARFALGGILLVFATIWVGSWIMHLDMADWLQFPIFFTAVVMFFVGLIALMYAILEL